MYLCLDNPPGEQPTEGLEPELACPRLSPSDVWIVPRKPAGLLFLRTLRNAAEACNRRRKQGLPTDVLSGLASCSSKYYSNTIGKLFGIAPDRFRHFIGGPAGLRARILRRWGEKYTIHATRIELVSPQALRSTHAPPLWMDAATLLWDSDHDDPAWFRPDGIRGMDIAAGKFVYPAYFSHLHTTVLTEPVSLLEGPPASGKSTVARTLSYELLQQGHNVHYLSCRELDPHRAYDIVSALADMEGIFILDDAHLAGRSLPRFLNTYRGHDNQHVLLIRSERTTWGVPSPTVATEDKSLTRLRRIRTRGTHAHVDSIISACLAGRCKVDARARHRLASIGAADLWMLGFALRAAFQDPGSSPDEWVRIGAAQSLDALYTVHHDREVLEYPQICVTLAYFGRYEAPVSRQFLVDYLGFSAAHLDALVMLRKVTHHYVNGESFYQLHHRSIAAAYHEYGAEYRPKKLRGLGSDIVLSFTGSQQMYTSRLVARYHGPDRARLISAIADNGQLRDLVRADPLEWIQLACDYKDVDCGTSNPRAHRGFSQALGELAANLAAADCWPWLFCAAYCMERNASDFRADFWASGVSAGLPAVSSDERDARYALLAIELLSRVDIAEARKQLLRWPPGAWKALWSQYARPYIEHYSALQPFLRRVRALGGRSPCARAAVTSIGPATLANSLQDFDTIPLVVVRELLGISRATGRDVLFSPEVRSKAEAELSTYSECDKCRRLGAWADIAPDLARAFSVCVHWRQVEHELQSLLGQTKSSRRARIAELRGVLDNVQALARCGVDTTDVWAVLNVPAMLATAKGQSGRELCDAAQALCICEEHYSPERVNGALQEHHWESYGTCSTDRLTLLGLTQELAAAMKGASGKLLRSARLCNDMAECAQALAYLAAIAPAQTDRVVERLLGTGSSACELLLEEKADVLFALALAGSDSVRDLWGRIDRDELESWLYNTSNMPDDAHDSEFYGKDKLVRSICAAAGRGCPIIMDWERFSKVQEWRPFHLYAKGLLGYVAGISIEHAQELCKTIGEGRIAELVVGSRSRRERAGTFAVLRRVDRHLASRVCEMCKPLWA